MAFFNFGKKSEPKHCCSCCACDKQESPAVSAVKVLGGGCNNCHKLQENTQEALKSLGMDTQVDLVTDPAAIVAYGVMSTPALVVDEKVVATGRVLTPQQAAEAIQNVRGTKA
ncbi:MAG TPA: thioredoxin family protein [Candidatus Limiplasma sp.]|nr:thioredoxin family protein [Candidatus Limiplasma sp.]